MIPAIGVAKQGGSGVLRRLEDGWHYAPDWRQQVIQDYLVEIAAATDREAALQAVLWREADPYIRQGTRWAYSGRCVHQAAIAWAFQTAQDAGKSGLSSRIQALVVADRFPEEIAELLRVPAAAVVAFEKLFWDVRRYLGTELWVASLVRSIEERRVANPQSTREAIWLRTALDEGWTGLERLWFRKRGTDAKALDAMAREIEGIAVRRTLRHLQQLEEAGAPVSDEDIKRLVLVSRKGASLKSDEGANQGMREFYEVLLGDMTQNLIKMEPESPRTKALELVIAERMGLPTPSTVPIRRRMRAFD